MNRRQFIRYALVALGAGVVSIGALDLLGGKLFSGGTTSSTTTSSSSSSQIGGQSLPDYQQFLTWLKSVSGPFKGKTLNITLEEEFTPLTLQLIDSDFASATGMNDQYSIKPYSLQLSDVSLMFETQSPTFDAFGVDNQNLGAFPSDSVSPLQLADSYPDLTYPGIDLADFDRFMWDNVATYPPSVSLGAGGSTPANVPVLPLDTPTMILYYRKDIYDKLSLSPPNTWDDHLSNIEAISKSGLIPFGAVSQAAPDISIVYEFLNHIASFGGQLFAVDGNNITPTVNDDKILAALENFVRLAPYSDTASSTYTWDDVFNSLAHGAAASGLLWNGYANWVNDATRSVAAGNIAFQKNPAGPAGSFSTFGGAGVGVSKYSKNPQAAWLWLQWATAKGTQEAMVLNKYHVYPTRDSPMSAPEVADALSSPQMAVANLTKGIWESGGVASLIGFPSWFEVLQALSYHLSQAWTGAETPTQALDKAQQAILGLGTLTF